jgi:hypothetical protein
MSPFTSPPAARRLQLEATDHQHGEVADLAVRAFELSQSLTERWVAADFAAKRQILEIICLNFRLDGATLCPTMRKPFDIAAEGLFFQSSRGDWIPIELFVHAVEGWEEDVKRLVMAA